MRIVGSYSSSGMRTLGSIACCRSSMLGVSSVSVGVPSRVVEALKADRDVRTRPPRSPLKERADHSLQATDETEVLSGN